MKKKIIQIIWGLQRGGAELLVLQICTGLIQKNNNIDLKVIVYKKALDLAPEFEKAGIEVICLDVFGKRFYKKIYLTYKLLKKLKPDIIHTHFTAVDHWALIAGFLAGIKHRFTTVHNIENVSSVKDNLFRIITSLLANKIIAVSHCAKKFYIKNKIYPAKKLDVIYN